MSTHGLPLHLSGDGGPPPLDEGQTALRVELRERRITAVTPALATLLGCAAERLVGRTLGDLWPEMERCAIAERFDDVVLLGHDAFGALAVVRDGAPSVWVDVDARYLYRGGQRLEILLAALERPDPAEVALARSDHTATTVERDAPAGVPSAGQG